MHGVRIGVAAILLSAGCGAAVDSSDEGGVGSGAGGMGHVRLESCVIARDAVVAGGIEYVASYDIAPAPDGTLHATWTTETLHTAEVGVDGVWRTTDNPWRDDDSHRAHLMGGGLASPVLFLEPAYGSEASSIWRLGAAGWTRVWDDPDDGGATQGRRPLAVTPDGTALYFSESDDDGSDASARLLALEVSTSVATELPRADLGRDPMIAVDPAGRRHVVTSDYRTDGSQLRPLRYIDEAGASTILLEDHSGWPDFAAADDGLYVAARANDLPVLVAGDGAGDWEVHPIGEVVLEACDPYAEHPLPGEQRVGETCDHFVRDYVRVSVIGGRYGFVLAEEILEHGQMSWECPTYHGAQCGWHRGEDFVDERRLMIGRATQDGVVLVPVPLALGGYKGTLDANGTPHLLFSEQTADGEHELRHVELDCESAGA